MALDRRRDPLGARLRNQRRGQQHPPHRDLDARKWFGAVCDQLAQAGLDLGRAIPPG